MRSRKKEVLSTYFSKEGLGYQLLRVPVDSCDFSLETYDSLVEKEPVKVAVQRAGKYIFPMLKDIFAVCEEQPEIMVSPWSPPEYMKQTDSAAGRTSEKGILSGLG